MTRDGGGTGAKPGPQDWTNSYQPVQVDVSSLFEYYMNMMTVQAQAAGPVGTVLPPMGEMITEALLTSKDPTAGTFAEGRVVAEVMAQNQSDFTNFLKDALQGVRCIGAAAAVIGEIYRNGDGENSANINDIDFVFADPGAKKPPGFPAGATTTTFSEAAANAAQDTTGQYCMAAMLPDSSAVKTAVPGGTLLTFPDKSTKLVKTVGGYGYEGTGSQTTTTISYQGKVVGSTVDSTMSIPGGTSYRTRSQSPTGDTNAPGSVTTGVQTNPDGSQTITTTTVGADKKLHTSAPVTVQPEQHDDTPTDAGPVQQAETDYDSKGSSHSVKTYGPGY